MAKPTAIISVQKNDPLWQPRLLIFGDPGVGKTPLIASEPKTLILEADPGGCQTAMMAGSKADRWPVKKHEDLTAACEYLRHEGFKEYRFAWLDSITIFQVYGLRQTMEELIKRSPHRKLWLADKGEYGTNMNRLKLWLQDMATLPMGVGITSHVMRGEDRDGNELFLPSIQGKGMADFFCGFMNIVAYMEAERDGSVVTKRLRFQKDEFYYGKDRYGLTEDGTLENPSMPEIQRLIAAAVARRGAETLPPRKATKATKAVKKSLPIKSVAKKAIPAKKATKKATRR